MPLYFIIIIIKKTCLFLLDKDKVNSFRLPNFYLPHIVSPCILSIPQHSGKLLKVLKLYAKKTLI